MLISPESLEELGPLPDYTSEKDLSRMAEAINMLSGMQDKGFFGCYVIANDLMRLQVEDVDTQPIIELAKANGVLMQAVNSMFQQNPELLDELIDNTVDHMLNGTDETDPKSAGGWNKEEVEKAYAGLVASRRGLTVPFFANRIPDVQ